MTLARRDAFRPRRADWAQAATMAVALFALYAASAPRTVALEDDGFFILASHFLGVAHPPGYPLHTLLGKLFTLLPVGSIAYRVHLLSAAFGALSCGALWLCGRVLFQERLPAYLAALGLGLSPAFWSQAIIAEVYTLNAFFFFALAYLGLRGGSLPAMALLFGFSLSNHWPLTLLCAPALAILLWPRWREIARRSPLLVVLVALGLLPYAVMVVRSWVSPIGFYGPVESWREFWSYVSRAAYASADVSPTATGLDQLRLLRFLGAELFAQFAIAGTVLAAAGCVVQWRVWGRRISLFLTVAFAMPSVVLLLMLGFDYDALHKQVFRVYPLPAYGMAALWLALGFAWLARRFALGRQASALAAVALVGLVAATGAARNWRADYDWTARYAETVLRSLPRDAALFLEGDADIGPIAYFHLVEGWRPDVTLHQTQGLLLGNRTFHPMRTSPEQMLAETAALIAREPQPVALTHLFIEGLPRRERFLYAEVDRSAAPGSITVDIPESMHRFFVQSVLSDAESDGWTRLYQHKLRFAMARLVAMSRPRAQLPDERTGVYFRELSGNFEGALGLAEGLLVNPAGHSAGEVAHYLELAGKLMPEDAEKSRQSRYFELRAYLRLGLGDRAGATQDLESALSLWPSAANRAAAALADLRGETADEKARAAIGARLTR